MKRCIVISGCSGGGKSTLLAELGRRGHPVVDEPGRRIVREQVTTGGSALPWVDPALFLRRVLALAAADRANCVGALAFFDRGLVDAALGLEHLGEASAASLLASCPAYERAVFLAPPWPDIYVTDSERRHGFDQAVAEYERLLIGYPRLGYSVILLPRLSVSERADFVLSSIARPSRE